MGLRLSSGWQVTLWAVATTKLLEQMVSESVAFAEAALEARNHVDGGDRDYVKAVTRENNH
jgi:hypothetical protein